MDVHDFITGGMIPRGRGGRSPSNYRGGGRGNNPSNQRSGKGKAIITHGQKQLFDMSNQAQSSSGANQFPLLQGQEQLFAQFMQFMQTSQGGITTPTPFKNTLIGESDNQITESDDFLITPHTETIMVLEPYDVENLDFNDKETPWNLLTRYLDIQNFKATAYKSRSFYERILIDTATCDIKHTWKEDKKSEKKFVLYSKIYIKKILTIEDWGLSPFREKTFINPENNLKINYNYWDYVDGLKNVFWYQNPNRKHSWFIKIASTVFITRLPNWFFEWWRSYGPPTDILIGPFKKYFEEWIQIYSSQLNSKPESIQNLIHSVEFFIGFSIPWIWKWEPIIDNDSSDFPKLIREFYTKFWVNMLKVDSKTGKLASQDTLDYIQETLLKLKEQRKISEKQKIKELGPVTPLHLIEAQLVARGIANPTQQDIMNEYMDQFQKDVVQYQQSMLKAKSDTSMKSFSDEENQFDCLAGESQEDDVEDMQNIPLQELLMELKYHLNPDQNTVTTEPYIEENTDTTTVPYAAKMSAMTSSSTKEEDKSEQ